MPQFRLIREIEKIAQQIASGINLKPFGKFRTIDDSYLNSYALKTSTLDDNVAFTIELPDGIVGVMICIEITGLKNKTLMIKRTWVNREFRNKGLMTNLYRYIYNTLGYSIISDLEASPETVSVWDKLQSQFNVKMIDLSNGQISNIDKESIFDHNKKMAYIIERNAIYCAL